jgi:hypothetical protein
MLRSIILFLIFFGSECNAKCDFNSSKYLNELANPKSINSINIDILKSKKWVSNAFKITLDKSAIINKKYKKKFKANIKIYYDFGVCSFKGKVRQTGDNKDHIQFNGLTAMQSLKVDLDKGNVLSATSFKLLIPSTRSGDNEIFGTLLLSQLGYIAPKTFSVKSHINGNLVKYLFQENPNKELLERNGRREGPIFEGDESLVSERFLTVESDKFWEVKKHIIGARLINDNWPNKSREYLLIALHSFILLQKEMLRYEISYPRKKLYLNPNNLNSNKNSFSKFNLLMLAMGGEHGLYSNNRKFYFDSLTGFFEPIYYDGDLDFQRSILEHLKVYGPDDLNHFFDDITEAGLANLKYQIINIDRMKLSEDFSNHSGKDIDKSSYNLSKFIDQILSNFDVLMELFESRSYVNNSEDDYSEVLHRIERKSIENKVDQNMLMVSHIDKKNFVLSLYCSKIINKNKWCDQHIVEFDEVIKIMNKTKFNGLRAILVDINSNINKINLFRTTKTSFGTITHSMGSEVKFTNKEKKTIYLNQNKADDRFIFKDIELNDVEIYLNGITAKNNLFSTTQSDNFGFTGCINFYNVIFKGTKINSNGGACEDSVNIVRSKGLINSINVLKAFSDAVDFDFSNLTVEKLLLTQAGNDCLDVSAGNYQIIELWAQDCGDKGISVGEESIFNGDNISVLKSFTGVASKDSSVTKIKDLKILKSKNCLQAYKKKPEFNGGIIGIDEYFCEGPIFTDINSTISVN